MIDYYSDNKNKLKLYWRIYQYLLYSENYKYHVHDTYNNNTICLKKYNKAYVDSIYAYIANYSKDSIFLKEKSGYDGVYL